MEFKKIREATKITYDKFGRERESKISELCQYCPNDNCPGYYRRDAPYACYTFARWKDGELSLEEAIAAKHRQHEWHSRIDPIRDMIFEMLEEQCYDYYDRVLAGEVASEVVKGAPIKKTLEEAGFMLSKEEIHAIARELSKAKAGQVAEEAK